LGAKKQVYRGRFAPSPTGPLHIGSLYTAVASYLQARSQGGQWLLRVDDLDPFRCKPRYSEQILHTLERYGLHWDEQVLYQSKRHDSYRAAIEQLQQQALLYPCQCSRKELNQRHIINGVYDQYCLKHPIPANQRAALRIQLNVDKICFNDQVQGQQQQDLKQQVGDFIVFRKDQVYAYHLAVIIDDAEQKISEVLRGYDLLDSTYRQIFLQHTLGINTPQYAHIPTINDDSGAKLSKQTYAPDIALSPVRETLINTLHYLNLRPAKDLINSEVSEILQWAVDEWSIKAIKPQTSIIL